MIDDLLASAQTEESSLAADVPAVSHATERFRLLGLLHRRFVLMESDDGLVLFDPKAARERILYEGMLQHRESGVPVQHLLVPVLLDLDPRDMDLILRERSSLASAGIEIEEFPARIAEVAEWVGLAGREDSKVRTYSHGMRARLAFALSLAIEFECYLIDEIILVGDQNFQRKCQAEMFEKRQDRSMLVASHSPEFIRSFCNKAILIHQGQARMMDDVNEAVDQAQLRGHVGCDSRCAIALGGCGHESSRRQRCLSRLAKSLGRHRRFGQP